VAIRSQAGRRAAGVGVGGSGRGLGGGLEHWWSRRCWTGHSGPDGGGLGLLRLADAGIIRGGGAAWTDLG
jgi:hypothetical protein